MQSNTNGLSPNTHVIVGVERKADHWVEGFCGEYRFQAKVYDTGSQFGIKGGRISKLNIWTNRPSEQRVEIANYDRGWDIMPDGEENIAALTVIYFCLNHLPSETAEPALEVRKEISDRPQVSSRKIVSPYERAKAQVYATGNKWAIENFHATHD